MVLNTRPLNHPKSETVSVLHMHTCSFYTLRLIDCIFFISVLGISCYQYKHVRLWSVWICIMFSAISNKIHQQQHYLKYTMDITSLSFLPWEIRKTVAYFSKHHDHTSHKQGKKRSRLKQDDKFTIQTNSF